MELGLSLGDTSRSFEFMEKQPREASNQLGLGFNTTLSIGPVITTKQRDQHQEFEQDHETAKQKHKHNTHNTTEQDHDEASNDQSLSPSLKINNNNQVLQLDLLLPHSRINPPPQISFPWHPPLENGGSTYSRGLDVNRAEDEAEEEAALSSSPNSTASSFQMDLCIFNRGSGSMSGEDENGGSTRKKLRLSKEQSAFLEESFKEHNTLNPVSVLNYIADSDKHA